MKRQRKGKPMGLKKGDKGNNSKAEATTKNAQSATEIGIKYIPLTLKAWIEASTSATNGRSARKENLVPPVDDTLDKINEVVIGKRMHLFQLSLLYNFSFEKNFLKKLSIALTHNIQKKNIFIINEPGEVAGSRKVNIAPLVSSDQKEIAGILLTVELVPDYEELVEEEEVGERPKKYEVFGVLCRDLNQTYNNDSDNVTNMPVFMLKGNASLTNLILQYFVKAFDCTIRDMKLSPVVLTWLAATWSGYPADIPSKDLKLNYIPTKEVEGLDKIGYNMNADNVHDLWNSVHNKDSDVFLLEEKNKLFVYLEQHFKECTRIHLSKMCLQEISTTSIFANSTGTVKLYSHTTAEVIINYLMILAKERKF